MMSFHRFPTVTPTSVVVEEGGLTDSYSIVLTSEPTANVTISVGVVESPAQTTLSATSLTFTSSNWNTAQTVTVTAVADLVIENSHTSTITPSATPTPPATRLRPEQPLPVSRVHALVFKDAGIYRIDMRGLDEIARNQVDEFLFMLAPLRVLGGTGSAVNPLAVV